MIKMELYMTEKLLAKNDMFLFAYKRGNIIVRRSENKQVVQKFKIHKGLKANPIIERLFRYEPRVAISLSEDIFIYSDHGSIYEYSVKHNSIKRQHTFSRGMNNPLTFCVRRNVNGSIVEIIYGEYIWNSDKGAVSIYRYDFKEWKEVFSFPEHTVKHIHNIIYDEFNDRYIIMTGDEDKESALWEADTDFQNVKMIVGGSQKYRACVVFPTPEGFFYATDTPLEQNWIYFYDYQDGLKEVYKMPGPCIYGRIFNNKFYMATSVEGDPTLVGWKYILSNKLGKGVYDRKVHIIRCDKEGKAEEVANLKKDMLPMGLFQFGNAQFPMIDDGVYISTQSTIEKGTFILKTEKREDIDMTNLERYEKAFCDSFEIGREQLKGLEYHQITSWDSVGHMELIAALEEEFDIMLETEDIIELTSFEKGKEILNNKYGIEF